MMFKRPPLRATCKHVNASLAGLLLFAVTACTPATEETAATPEVAPVEAPSGGLTLPAVWNTSPLPTKPVSIGVAGGPSSRFALVDDTGGLQIFDFEADRMTDISDLGVRQITNGIYARLSGTALTLFPGISQTGDLELYIHSGDMTEALSYQFNIDQLGPAAGLCMAEPDHSSDGVMRLAYWTEGVPRTLHSGRLVPVGDDLVFLADEPVQANAPITACRLDETGATVFAEPVRTASVLERNGNRFTLTLDSSGNLKRLLPDGTPEDLLITDGLSVNMPPLVVDMAATGDARSGGYPGGVVIMIGEVAPGDYRATLVDPSKLTLDPFQPRL